MAESSSMAPATSTATTPAVSLNTSTTTTTTGNKNILENDPWSESKLQEAISAWKLSADDEKRLRVLQHRLRDVKHPWNDPHVVLGFALQHGWKTTEKRFRKMIQWRIQNKVDRLLTEFQPNPLLLDNSPVAFLKDYDRDGDPIYLERGGAVDAKGLLKRFPKEELLRHAVWLREVQCSGAWVDEYERRQGRPVTNITVVYDLKGLCPRHLHPGVLGFFQNLMKLTDDYYPGPIKRMIIIRAPHIFRFVWKTVKHFFSEECRDKMIFAPSDYLSVLRKYMDITVLPPCINPHSGTGETAVGMPKRMDVVAKIPDTIGKGGVGYIIPTTRGDSGISEASCFTNGNNNNNKAVEESTTSSICSSTEDEDASSREGEEVGVDNRRTIMTDNELVAAAAIVVKSS